MRGQFDIIALKRSIRLSEIVGRDVQWDQRKTVAARGDYWGCCPFHGEKSPSFHVVDPEGFYKCFACSARGDHIDYLMAIMGCQKGQAITQLAMLAGVAPGATELPRSARPALPASDTSPTDKAAQRTAQARRIWLASTPLANTLAERYLIGRWLPGEGVRANELRFAESLEYELGAQYADGIRIAPGPKHPALIARVDNVAGELVGLWRVFVAGDGRKADLSPCKVGMGPVRGGAVRLFGMPVDGRIGIAEGIETALAVRALTGMTCWAGLSTSGIQTFEVPEGITHVSIFPDGDIPKRNARTGEWFCAGDKAAQALRARLDVEGVPCTVEPAPRGGRDYLDVLAALQRIEGRA